MKKVGFLFMLAIAAVALVSQTTAQQSTGMADTNMNSIMVGDDQAISTKAHPWEGVIFDNIAMQSEAYETYEGYFSPLSLSNPSSETAAIHYSPKGRYINMRPIYAEMMAIQQGKHPMLNRDGDGCYFGRDFSLGIIDNNYRDASFITQFLTDP